jgi:hypothetical protein
MKKLIDAKKKGKQCQPFGYIKYTPDKQSQNNCDAI